jgi:hypothetical protein
MSLAALIAWPDDKLAGAVANELSQRGHPWRWLIPTTLASFRASICDGVLLLDCDRVDTVLWRVAPDADLSVDFAPDDRVFADTEARSFWLAALNLDSVRSMVRPPAELFFARSGWLYWREVLGRRSVQLAPLRFGSDLRFDTDSTSWLPYGASVLRPAPSLAIVEMLGAAVTQLNATLRVHFAGPALIGCSALTEQASKNLHKAASSLNDEGLYLGEMLATPDGSVLAVDAFPRIEDADTVSQLLPATWKLLNDCPDRR